ncbi:MAG: hypothetical protein H0V37_13275 [Chloroflexia bacterium]|nr:hypothetical protein [Chloroflexia bacterium]
MSSIRSRWRALAALLAVCSLALMSFVPAQTLAQSSTAPGGHAQVIAQGVDLMPRVPVAWRITASEAAPLDEGEFFDRTLGFAVGEGDPFLVTDGESEALTLLLEGQASFHPEGASERRSSTDDSAVDYLNIELIVADAVDTDESLGSSSLVFAGDEFEAPRGYRDLRLTRDVLAPSEEHELAGSGDAPSLLFVTAGALQVADADGDVTELGSGDALQVTGDAELLAGADDGATWLLASIGDEVELPEAAPAATSDPDAETGTLELRLEACPDSLDADCTPVTNRDVTVPAFHLVEDEDNWIIPDRADLSDDDTVLTYDNLPAGDYVTMPDNEAVPGVTIDGATWDNDLDGWTFEVEADETTVLTLRVIVDDRGDTGSLLVTLYDCPAGSDPENDPSSCELNAEPWDVSVANIGQTETTEWTLASDALDLGDSQYWFELLPATSLTFYPDGAREVGTSDVVVTGDPYVLGNLWTIDIPYHGAGEAMLYHVEPGEEPADTGSLFFAELICPAGTDGSDLSPCQNAGEPWDILFENVDTGETYSAFADAEPEMQGQFSFPALPAGTYTMYGANPSDDGLVYLDGDVETGGDWPTVTISGGGEHILYVYFVPPGGSDVPDAPAGGTGSLVIYQSDCPYGVDPSVDTSACATSVDPWEVTVTNDATGNSWSLLFEGVAYDTGTYVLEALPAGSYSISVGSNENWALYYPSTTDVSADDETYVTIYSVDLRAP